jgi:YidC/Oxa1 family membrane protein insertase
MQKNVILFIVLAALLVGGWIGLQAWLGPPPSPAKKADEVAQADKKDQKKEEPPVKEKEPPAKKDEAKEKKEEKKVQPPVPADGAKPPPPTKVTIGEGDDYFIKAVLTSLGGGVQRLTLTRFEAANWLGLPEPGVKMELIQDDPYRPSFRLYNFPDGKDDIPPVLGLGEIHWKHEKTEEKDGGQEVTFSTHVPGLEQVKVTKVYRLEPRSYHLDLRLIFEVSKDGPVTPWRYQMTGGQGTPIEGEWFTGIFRNAVVGIVDKAGGVWRDLETADRISFRAGGEKVPPGNRGDSLVQYAGVLNQYFATVILPDNVQPGGADPSNLIAWARPTQETAEVRGRILKIDPDRIEFMEPGTKTPRTYLLLDRVKKHLAELDLREGSDAVLSQYELPDGRLVATWVRLGRTPRPSFDDITVRVNSEPIHLKPGQPVEHRYLLYHGPAKTRLLGHLGGADAVTAELVDRYTDVLHLRTLTDYRSPGAMGSFSQFIHLTDLIIVVTRLMHALLWGISAVIPSYGLSIILLTVIVRGLMFPISRRQALFSVRMQELAPEMKKLQEKYKNDPQAKTQAVMELYRKHKIHPLGSCLPLLMQMPIFLGLYFSLQESIFFRLAPFLWIRNLAAPDMLLWWGQSIPFISDPDSMGGVFYLGPFLNVLPIGAVILMVIQQQLMTPPAADEQQEAQQKMMKFMSIFIGILFYKMPAGLCIYFISSSLWGLAERKLLPRKKAVPGAGAEPDGGSPAKLPPRGPGRGGGRNQPKQPDANGTMKKLKDWWAEILKQAEKK